MEIWWKNVGCENSMYSKRKLFFFFITLLKENPTWSGMGINLGPRDERPRTDRMFMENRVLKRKLGPKTQVIFHDTKSDNLSSHS